MRPIRCLSPLEAIRGVRPSQAAKCRADRNWRASPTAATKAEAVKGSIPGTPARRLLLSLAWCQATISASTVLARRRSSSIRSNSISIAIRASGGTSSGMLAPSRRRSSSSRVIPLAATSPNSPSKSRAALIVAVRCRTRRERTRCREARLVAPPSLSAQNACSAAQRSRKSPPRRRRRSCSSSRTA